VLSDKLTSERYDRVRRVLEAATGDGPLAGYKFTPPPKREEEAAAKAAKAAAAAAAASGSAAPPAAGGGAPAAGDADSSLDSDSDGSSPLLSARGILGRKRNAATAGLAFGPAISDPDADVN
jgi:hypothetical protein